MEASSMAADLWHAGGYQLLRTTAWGAIGVKIRDFLLQGFESSAAH